MFGPNNMLGYSPENKNDFRLPFKVSFAAAAWNGDISQAKPPLARCCWARCPFPCQQERPRAESHAGFADPAAVQVESPAGAGHHHTASHHRGAPRRVLQRRRRAQASLVSSGSPSPELRWRNRDIDAPLKRERTVRPCRTTCAKSANQCASKTQSNLSAASLLAKHPSFPRNLL